MEPFLTGMTFESQIGLLTGLIQGHVNSQCWRPDDVCPQPLSRPITAILDALEPLSQADH